MEPRKSNLNEKLISAEMGKLWATYMGNSMSTCILSYFLKHVEDQDIKKLLENALNLSKEFQKIIKGIFIKENFPIPHGFTKEDVNLDAPRLFEDEFYVHYLKYVSKVGLSLYSVGLPLIYREDVRDFSLYCMESTVKLGEHIKDISMNKGLAIKSPIIPTPQKVNIAHKNYLKGFIGDVRPLHALEIAHLYDNLETNLASKALVMAFSQVTKTKKVRELFVKGEELTDKIIEGFIQKLHQDNLPSPSLIDHLVTTSTTSPFSDKLMVFHKMDMFSMRVRNFGNSMAVNGRRDLALLYAKSLKDISDFVHDAADIMIENEWMETPPEAADREDLASE
ncbi:hypothetical protein COJ90_28760 [Priestia megaterium]|jgi:hypothetical protein|uniref:DUF3231 family protein n=1 Tax=Priestia megaterium TaxID=1404 RepID=UPI000BF79F03|nr:DUF3231 family protein [Priestia megaterium]PFP04478.1 hypothetical protein COJ90_28760 [Priestia megaterium]